MTHTIKPYLPGHGPEVTFTFRDGSHAGYDGDVTDDTGEIDPLHEWRMQMLQGVGFDEFTAFRLSVNGADWHAAARLLRDGATADQILRILLD